MLIQEIYPILGFLEVEKREEGLLSHVLLTLSDMIHQLCDVIALVCVNSPVLSPTVYCRDQLSANLKVNHSLNTIKMLHIVQQKYKFRD